jgi:outer membrane protein
MKYLAATLTALALGAAFPAEARVLDRVQIKGSVIGVLPDEDAAISGIGGNVKISDETVPAVQIEYFFGEHLSAELLCCVARHEVAAVDTALGRVNLGKVTHFPPTVTVKYRWTNLGRFEPYVGAGVNYTHFFDEEVPNGGPVTRIDYDDSIGPALQIGADVRLNDHWSLNVDARKIWISTDVAIQAGATRINADVDIDPWVVGVGLGYRF